MGGKDKHLVLVCADRGPYEVLGVDEAFIELEACLIGTSPHPGHCLPVGGAEAGDGSGEGVPQLHLDLRHGGVKGGALPPQLVFAVVAPSVNFPTDSQSHRVVASSCDPGHLL